MNFVSLGCLCALQTMLRRHRAGGLVGATECLRSDPLSRCGHVAGAAGGRGAQPRWVSLLVSSDTVSCQVPADELLAILLNAHVGVLCYLK